MGEICVVVDNSRLEPLLDNSDGALGSLRLTTIKSGQKRALIEIRSRSGSRSVTLYSIEAVGLPGDKPDMAVRGEIDARTLNLEFLLKGKVFHHATIKLPAPRRMAWWILIPATLVAAALLLLLLPRPAVTSNETTYIAPPPVTTVEALPDHTPKPAATPVQSEITPVVLSQTIYFLPDDATLISGARNLLDELLASFGEETEWRLEITGHCALAGSEKGRTDLSWMRAREVFSYLSTAGFIQEMEPEINGVGGNQPVTHDPELQHLNRRVEITASATASAATRPAGSG
jgi:outer membrane protein OmpA-like peptidoglycan-associated protein